MSATIYICKMCFRGLKNEDPPQFCYFDRMDSESQGLENISKEQAFLMGMKPEFVNSPLCLLFEFPGDVRYDPMTGSAVNGEGYTLTDLQDEVMAKCLET